MTGRRAPTVKIPHDVVLPLAAGAEFLARFTRREPFATCDGINLARKRMFFTCAKAKTELGYQPRPANVALADAFAWYRDNGYLR
jgi:dihydroflavonol-4-reductase